MKKLIITGLFISSLFSAQFTIVQKDRTYIPRVLNVSVGDTIIFENLDPYPHISYSADPLNGFNTGLQKKGEVKKIEVTSKGTFMIKCSLHPNMTMEVNVK